MWNVDLGEIVYVDMPNGQLETFRYVGGFKSWQDAQDFCARYPFLRNAQYFHIRSVADFESGTIRQR